MVPKPELTRHRALFFGLVLSVSLLLGRKDSLIPLARQKGWQESVGRRRNPGFLEDCSNHWFHTLGSVSEVYDWSLGGITCHKCNFHRLLEAQVLVDRKVQMRLTEETRLAACCRVPLCPQDSLGGRRAFPPAHRGRCGRVRLTAGGGPGRGLSRRRGRLRDRTPGRRALAAVSVRGPGHAATGGRSGSRSSEGAETDPLAAERQWDLGAPGSFGLHHLSDCAVPAGNQ